MKKFLVFTIAILLLSACFGQGNQQSGTIGYGNWERLADGLFRYVDHTYGVVIYKNNDTLALWPLKEGK